MQVSNTAWSLAGLAFAFGVSGCGEAAPTATVARSPTAGIYDDFLQSRTLATTLTAGHEDLDPVARQAKISEDRKLLANLEAGLASRRALLDDASRAAAPGSPDESLYYQIWSGQLADGAQPVFRRLAGGGLEYGGKQFTKEVALKCAVPSSTRDYTHRPFLDCLKRLPAASPAPTQTAAK
jgi:hypothetical protein